MNDTAKLFYSNVNTDEQGCQHWTGYFFDPQGKPLFTYGGKPRLAQEVAWILADLGEPKSGLVTTCGNDECVNVAHLREVSGEPRSRLDDLPLNQITRSLDTQPREFIQISVIDEYTEAYRGGTVFPPIAIFFDGSNYWLADGYHRVEAAEKAGRNKIAAHVYEGTKRDAIMYSAGANATHGLRRSTQDTLAALRKLLADEEWCRWSNARLGKVLGVSDVRVLQLKRMLGYEGDGTVLVQRGDQEYIMDVSGLQAERDDRDDVEDVPDSDGTFHSKLTALAEHFSMPASEVVMMLVDSAYNKIIEKGLTWGEYLEDGQFKSE